MRAAVLNYSKMFAANTSHNIVCRSIDAALDSIYTPPQVDRSTLVNRRVAVVGKRGYKALTSFIIHRLLHISLLEKVMACFSLHELYPRIEDIQTYCYPTDISDDRRSSISVLAAPGLPVAEGEQKKGGKRPGKPEPDQSESEKTRREGDQGSQRVKRPKKEGSK